MGGCDCYAGGGEVSDNNLYGSGSHRRDEKGVHNESHYPGAKQGTSVAGNALRRGRTALAQFGHEDKLAELKALPKPKLQGLAKGGKVYEVGPMKDTRQPSKEAMTAYDEGGDVDADGDYDGDMDNEILDQCCDELLSAFEKKDKKEILESLKAIILSVGK